MKMMIKVSIDRFDKVLKEDVPEVFDRFDAYERYATIDKIRKMVSYSDGEYIYVDYDMVCWMEEEGL